jgi:phosphoglycolate phosphatase
MAESAGVFAIWAKYGAFHQQEEYEKLVRVSHWTEQDVMRERELKERAQGIDVDYILESDFSDIVHALEHSIQPIVTSR